MPQIIMSRSRSIRGIRMSLRAQRERERAISGRKASQLSDSRVRKRQYRRVYYAPRAVGLSTDDVERSLSDCYLKFGYFSFFEIFSE